MTGLFDDAFHDQIEITTFPLPLVGIQLSTNWLNQPLHDVDSFACEMKVLLEEKEMAA